MALTKVSGGILDPGINVAGIVTATGFDGPFTGGSSKNITAGIITATGFDLNGNGDISGNLVIGGNLTANGDFTTLNTTLREVELLRVDANSSAIAGIITQRGSGDIFSAYDTSTQVFKIADGGDITFFGGSNSKNASWDYSTNTLSFDGNGSVNNQYAKTQFGSTSQGMKLYNNLNNFISVPPIVALFVESADFQIYGSGSRGGTTYDGTIFIAREGVVELGHEVGGGGATGMKLKTVGYGVTILGTTETQKLNVTGISTFTGISKFDGNLDINADVDISGYTYMGNTTIAGVTTFVSSGAPAVKIVQSALNTNAEMDINATNGGQARLNLRTSKSGTNRAARIDFFNQHSSTTPTWTLINDYDQDATNDFRLVHFNEKAIVAKTDGVVELYYDGNIKFNTASTGATVHGTSDPNLTIRQGGSSSSGSGFLAYENVDGNGVPRVIAKIQGKTAGNGGYGDLIFQTAFNNSLITRWTIDNGGHLLPGAVGSYNIGSATAEIGDVYFANSKGLKLGSNQAGDLYNDGTDTYFRNSASNGQMLIRSNGNILISNYAADEYRIKTFNNGAVELYYDQSAHATAKLATTATGVSVHGEVAASQDYPNFRPTLDFNFAATKKLDSRITYQRTGPASFINEFGKVVLVGDNTPRFDHDPDTRECKGLLIEPSRTNVAPYTDLSQYSGYNFTSTANDDVAPDGTTTATKIEHGGSGTSYLDHINTSINAQNAGPYTYSVWLKAPDDQPDGYYGCRIAVLHSTGGNVEPTVSLNKTWTRYSVTKTFGASDGGNLRVHLIMFRASPGATYDGKVIPSYVWAWGAQIEAGSYATSYIPTAGATRGADFPVIVEENFSDVINQTEGTLIAEHDNVTNDGYVLSLDGSGGNKIGMVNSNGYQLMGTAGGSSQGTTDNGTLLSGTNRFALAYKTNDAAISINGNTATVDTSYTLPTTTFMSIGHRQYQYDHLGSCIARIMYYNSRLPNSQLKTLSTR